MDKFVNIVFKPWQQWLISGKGPCATCCNLDFSFIFNLNSNSPYFSFSFCLFSSVVAAIAGKGDGIWCRLVQPWLPPFPLFQPPPPPPPPSPCCHQGVPELSSLQPMQVIQAYFPSKVALASSKVPRHQSNPLWAFVAEHLHHHLNCGFGEQENPINILFYLLDIMLQCRG